MQVIILCLSFAGGFLLVFGTNMMLADVAMERRRQLQERLEEEVRRKQQARAREALQFRRLDHLSEEGFNRDKKTAKQRFLELIEQSGLRINPGQVIAMCLVAAFLPSLLTLGITQNLVFALMAGLMCSLIPIMFIRHAKAQRAKKLRSQLPDAFDLMSRMLKAGQTIPQAMQGVADEFPHPLATEFGCCYEQQNLGMNMDAALNDLARRTGLLEIQIFVVSASIHQQAGGNFSQLLEKLSTVIRARDKIRGQIKALTAEGKMQAIILLGLPFVLLFGLMFITKDYAMTLFEHYYLLVGMVISEAIGALWISKIINFDF